MWLVVGVYLDQLQCFVKVWSSSLQEKARGFCFDMILYRWSKWEKSDTNWFHSSLRNLIMWMWRVVELANTITSVAWPWVKHHYGHVYIITPSLLPLYPLNHHKLAPSILIFTKGKVGGFHFEGVLDLLYGSAAGFSNSFANWYATLQIAE